MSRFIDHQFPIRPNTIATLKLPANLTRMEASRLSRFVDSLAVDATPEDRQAWNKADDTADIVGRDEDGYMSRNMQVPGVTTL